MLERHAIPLSTGTTVATEVQLDSPQPEVVCLARRSRTSTTPWAACFRTCCPAAQCAPRTPRPSPATLGCAPTSSSPRQAARPWSSRPSTCPRVPSNRRPRPASGWRWPPTGASSRQPSPSATRTRLAMPTTYAPPCRRPASGTASSLRTAARVASRSPAGWRVPLRTWPTWCAWCPSPSAPSNGQPPRSRRE